jgi:photosystem II stability/assembly factor-like uncharacterized protein
MFRWLLAAALVTALTVPGQTQDGARWTLQYFYDQDGKDLHIIDLAFPSAKRGIAVGTIIDRGGDRKPQFTSLITSDGGEHWSLTPLKEFPRSIFFLDESNGWLVTGESLWFTQEAGRSWTRISDQIKPDKKLADAPRTGLILRVLFLDAQHGYAVGLQKSVYENHDGGRSWKPLAEAAVPTSNPAYSVYSQIAFADGKRGMIAGRYAPPRAEGKSHVERDEEDGLPDWMHPERTLNQRQQPRLTLEVDTLDGGVTWKSGTAPLLGSLVSTRLAGENGLLIFNYADSFEWPAEVYRLDLKTGRSESAYKKKDRRVTDAAIFPEGAEGVSRAGARAFLAAVEPPGRLRSAPIPGKVRMLSSTNLRDWVEMPVDYRAVAQSLVLAGPDPEHLWAATDTGMILHLSISAGMPR